MTSNFFFGITGAVGKWIVCWNSVGNRCRIRNIDIYPENFSQKVGLILGTIAGISPAASVTHGDV